MDIGIIGSGNIGGVLVRRLRELGHDVKVANSRGPESLADLAKETGATAATVEEAARAADVVVVTIPQAAVPDLPAGILADTKAVVVDTGNYYPVRDGRIAEIDGGMVESEWVARKLGHPVVKAFNNIYAAHLGTKGVPAGTAGRIALPVAGDDQHSKDVVIRLIDELGFDGVDAGPIADSWRQQPGTPVYASDHDAEGVKAALAQAEAGRIDEYRNAADEAAKAWFA
jgi:predicted dinucleotide-binding enzyme